MTTEVQAPESIRDAISILREAEETLLKRQNHYGPPADIFNDVASIWRDTFRHSMDDEDVALAMVLMKVIRYQKGGGTPDQRRDSLVDICGYAALAHQLSVDKRILKHPEDRALPRNTEGGVK